MKRLILSLATAAAVAAPMALTATTAFADDDRRGRHEERWDRRDDRADRRWDRRDDRWDRRDDRRARITVWRIVIVGSADR